MGYMEELRDFVSEKGSDNAPTKPTEPPRGAQNEGLVGLVSDPVGRFHGKRLLGSWRDAVISLDPRKPLRGYEPKRWFNLVEASQWWLAGFGRQAALDGWGTSDVFGVLEENPRAGGLIDRLGTSRSLVMEGGRARWRSFGVPMSFNRGAYTNLRPFWDAPSDPRNNSDD